MLGRRGFMRAAVSLAGLLGLGRAKAEGPPRWVKTDHNSLAFKAHDTLGCMDFLLSECEAAGRAPVSFTLGSEALKRWDAAMFDLARERYARYWTRIDKVESFGITEGRWNADGVREFRGIPVEPSHSDIPSLVIHLHTECSG